MTGRQRVLEALQRKEPDSVPTFEWAIDRKVCRDIAGSEDPLDLIDHLDVDGVVARPDYTKEYVGKDVYVDEWGRRRQVTGETIDVVRESPIRDIRDHRGYRFPDPCAAHRFETLQRAVDRFGEKRAVVLQVRDVFSDIRDLVGYENALIALISEQKSYCELVDRVIEYNRTLARVARDRYKIDILATADDIADARGLICGPDLYFSFLGPKFREAAAGFKDLGYFYIKHSDGNVMEVVEYWIDCGVDCLDPIDPNGGMDIQRIKEEYGEKICLKGNINCETTLVSGSGEDVRREVKECIEKGGRGGGLILSSSNTIHSGVPAENYRAMIDALRRFGKYPLS
jgi:uroporphyrinogen decarboxylase